MTGPNPRSFRRLMGCFATGVTVVTVRDKNLGDVGITINSFTSVSLKPPLILFCLEKDAQLYAALKRAKFFTVNILGAAQEDVSRHFADYRHNPKPKRMWDRPWRGHPVLRGTLGWMLCRKTNAYKGGDHTIFLGEVVALRQRGGKHDPLLYFHSRYRTAG